MPPSVLYTKIDAPPPEIIRSEGNYLETNDGRRIFDASGGAAVACLGHNDARVKEAIIAQLDKTAYVYSPFFTVPAAEEIATFLTESTNGAMSRVFIVSSGTEAIEAALKLARQYFTELPQPQLQRTRFIARRQSYHGNTLGSLAAGGHKARRAIYEPILAQNTSHVSPCYPYRDMWRDESEEEYVARLAQELENEFQRVGPETVCAFVAETMAGTTLGCVLAVPGYFKAIKEVCDRHGALLVLDEVMSGMGRTGTLHAWEQEGIVPDLQTIAKGLGGGYAPVGALLINSRVVDVLGQGSGRFTHSQTYQGHPIACATACAVQKIIRDDNLLQNVREQGAYLGQLLKERLAGHKHVGDVRGRGLFWALEFVKDKTTKESFPVTSGIAQRVHLTGLQAEHCISVIPGVGVADGKNGDIIQIAPAYNITRAEIEQIVERLEGVIEKVFAAL
ncbi:pyridoxal phosphate-dependent transferase [Aspergillus karnatakaensis]|uniref:pyridoxal phosphate-dependent transferase n=1 Tax=Aspergillus karnatakaensis TaxID=1810916 RepID=UPI003CCCF658